MLAPALLALALVISAGEVRVIDGDTLKARGEVYRLAGVDAPEARGAACLAERQAGAAAAQLVRALIDDAALIEVSPARNPKGPRVWPRDRYNRRLAHVSLDGVDLGDTLIAGGQAAAWNPSNPRDWCALPAQP